MKDTFRLVFDGRIADGQTEKSVREALSSRLKIGASAVNAILTGKAVVLKKNMDAGVARRYQKAFESAGLICRLDSEGQEELCPDHTMECPKCGFGQPLADECVKCGVIIAKVQAVQDAVQNVEKERLDNLAAAKPLLDILGEYKELIKTDRTFFAPDIPDKMQQMAKSKFAPWADVEIPLFLYDKSMRKNGSTGLVITDRAVYFKTDLVHRFTYAWEDIKRCDFKPGMQEGLAVNGALVSGMEHMVREKQVMFAEMLMDLKSEKLKKEKRILIPYGVDIDFPQICCGCLAAASGRGVALHLNQKPPKSIGRKVGGFALDAVLYNLSPTAFFVTRMMGNSSKSFLLNGFAPSIIKLPFCFDCIPKKKTTGGPIDDIQTWPGKSVALGFATVKAGFSWFDISFDTPEFAERLIRQNPETVFASWIEMSTFVPEDDVENEEISGGYDFQGATPPDGKATDNEPVDSGPVNPTKAFASLVKGSSSFPAIAIPEKKLKNALASFARLNPDEKVVGLHDYTVMGSAKKGVVFTDQGIYWDNGKNKGHIRYEEIDPDDILCTRIDSVTAVVVSPDKWLPFTVIRVKDLEWVVNYLKRVC